VAHAIKERRHALSRMEFVLAVVQLAIHRFVLPGELSNVSEAVDRLLGTVITSRANALFAAEPNAFRRGHAYSETITAALRRNEATLARCFGSIAQLGNQLCGKLTAKVSGQTVIWFAGWVPALKALEIIGDDLSERSAVLCFAYSRMAVADYMSAKGHAKEQALPFEGFLEVCCRFAYLKALPTEADLIAHKSHTMSAGRYLASLADNDHPRYVRLLSERRRPWASEPPQDLPRCVDRLSSVLDVWISRHQKNVTSAR